VAGAANSGCQIAQELSATHAVELSAGQRIPAIPQRPLGRDIWTWATGLRLDPDRGGSPAATASVSGRKQLARPGER
jgi:putative flavoprotein involved in K+ transport